MNECLIQGVCFPSPSLFIYVFACRLVWFVGKQTCFCFLLYSIHDDSLIPTIIILMFKLLQLCPARDPSKGLFPSCSNIPIIFFAYFLITSLWSSTLVWLRLIFYPSLSQKGHFILAYTGLFWWEEWFKDTGTQYFLNVLKTENIVLGKWIPGQLELVQWETLSQKTHSPLP